MRHQIVSLYNNKGGVEPHGYYGINSTSYVPVAFGGCFLDPDQDWITGELNVIKYTGNPEVDFRIKAKIEVDNNGTSQVVEQVACEFDVTPTANDTTVSFTGNLATALGATIWDNVANKDAYIKITLEMKVSEGRAGWKVAEDVTVREI